MLGLSRVHATAQPKKRTSSNLVTCTGGRLQPTVEEPYEVEEEDGDVEVTHAEHNVMMGETGPNPSDIGVDGGSLPHLSAVPFNPLLENSASMGIGGDNSQMQSSSNPRAPGPSGVLRQAYDLVDSMGQVADHTVVPSDHLDTGVMISVPQVRLLCDCGEYCAFCEEKKCTLRSC